MLACLVTDLTPLSIQASKLQGYKKRLLKEFQAQRISFSGIPFSFSLYSKVIYIHLRHTSLDVDNMSKPIVDAFNGVLYTDDKIINHRVCSKISFDDLGSYELDLKALPPEILERFDKYLSRGSEHILYYEIGKFNETMVYIGGEKHET